MRYALSLAGLLAALLGLSLAISAAEDTSPTVSPPGATAPAEKQPELTPEEKAKKETRKAAKPRSATSSRGGTPRRGHLLRHNEDLARRGHRQDAWRQDRVAVGQGGLPVEARASARTTGQGHERAGIRNRHAAAEGTLHACPRRRKASLTWSRSPCRPR